MSFGGVSFFGTIEQAEGTNVQFIGADSRSECLFNLDGATFEYADPRVAPEPIRSKSSATYESCLGAVLPIGDQIAIFELK
jgi:hypothetical protein